MKKIVTRAFEPVLAIGVVVGSPVPAMAQDSADVRLRKIEAEVRALQRKVFPGGDGKYFTPEITAAQGQPTTTNAPSTTAVTDILARLDALEAQIQRLTATNEENSNAIAGLQTRLAALESAPAGTSSTLPNTTVTTPPAAGQNASQSNLGAMTGGQSNVATPTPTPAPTPAAATGPSAQRIEAVSKIAKPQTDDQADDEYSYGFRLWEAGFYPEAQQQLTMFVEKYPTHWRTTYGRNLLGRAYLDDNKPREAAPWFLRNYQTDKQGARAGDSLLFLAESMIALEDTNRACIALAEFGETFAALASGRLQDQYEANRRKVRCN